MQPLKRITSRTVVIASTDIDTDQIIPARFLTTTTKEGLGQQLFADWRYQEDGTPKREFVLITKRGKPVAKLVPADKDDDDFYGFFASKGTITGDVVSPAFSPEEWGDLY